MEESQTLSSFACTAQVCKHSCDPRERPCNFCLYVKKRGDQSRPACFIRMTGKAKGSTILKMKVSPAVIQSVVESRAEDGRLTIVLNSNDQIVLSDVKDIPSLRKCCNMLLRISAGLTGATRTGAGTGSSLCSHTTATAAGAASAVRAVDLCSSSPSPSQKFTPNRVRGVSPAIATEKQQYFGSKTDTRPSTSSFYGSHLQDQDSNNSFLSSSYSTQQRTLPPNKKRIMLIPSTRRCLQLHHREDDTEDPVLPGQLGKPSSCASSERLPLSEVSHHGRIGIGTGSGVVGGSSAGVKGQPRWRREQAGEAWGGRRRESQEVEGFANLGNTCYMNAVLQSLLGLEPFASDLLNQHLITHVHPKSLYTMMYLLLKSKLAKGSYESQRILLKKMKSIISLSAAKFCGFKEQDAHELLNMCLDQLKDDVDTLDKPAKQQQQDKDLQGSVSPVIRNFQSEIMHTLTCKNCRKVVKTTQENYDFPIQLPKSIYMKPTDQANLAQLFELFFKSEVVEHKCSACGGKEATLVHSLKRLPRVLILYLKRYGFSENSKRGDFIRIPRFINIGQFCSSDVEPPYDFNGPLPSDDSVSPSQATVHLHTEDKENLSPPHDHSTSDSPSPAVSFGEPTATASVGAPVSTTGESTASVNVEVADPRVSANRGLLSANYGHHQYIDLTEPACTVPPSTRKCVSASCSTETSAIPISESTPNCSAAAATDPNTSTSDFCASSHRSDPPSAALAAAARTHTLTSTNVVQSDPVTPKGLSGETLLGKRSSSERDSSCNAALSCAKGDESQSPTAAKVPCKGTGSLPKTVKKPVDNILDEFDALFDSPEVIFDFEKPLNTPPAKHQQALPKLLSLSSKDCQPTCSPAKASTPVAAHLTEEAGTPDVSCEEELHRALEESKRFNQPSEVMRLQELGLSEEEQLKMALELSMQEPTTAEDEETQEASSVEKELNSVGNSPSQETYRLMSIVSHIGSGSSTGHYISDVLCAKEGTWKSYNDSVVTEIREEDVRQRRQRTGYIFFYMHKSTYQKCHKMSST